MLIEELLELNKEYPILKKKQILSIILDVSIPQLLISNNYKLTRRELKKYYKYLNSTKPLQYLIGKASFFRRVYKINKNVLIPRFETEFLVDDSIKLIKKHFPNQEIKVLDIGTGSGVIAITIKQEISRIKVDAIDISSKALNVAKYNSKNLNSNINIFKSNLFSKVTEKYDFIISNPPYIKDKDTNIEEIVKNNEPKIALFGKEDGLYFYRQILKNAREYLNEKNIIAFEFGYDQKESIIALVKKYFPNSKIIAKKDLNNYDRYIYIMNNIE